MGCFVLKIHGVSIFQGFQAQNHVTDMDFWVGKQLEVQRHYLKGPWYVM